MLAGWCRPKPHGWQLDTATCAWSVVRVVMVVTAARMGWEERMEMGLVRAR